MYEDQIVYMRVMIFFERQYFWCQFHIFPDDQKKFYLMENVTFFLSILKLSIMTPMNRFSVKNEPTMINITKNK